MNASANEVEAISEHAESTNSSTIISLIILCTLSILLCIYFLIHYYINNRRRWQNSAINANIPNEGEMIILERQTSRILSYTGEHEIERSKLLHKSF